MRMPVLAGLAGVVLALPIGATPASASPGAFVMNCSTLFDAPNGTGTATCTLTGVVNSVPWVTVPESIDYVATPTCPTSTLDGVVYGGPVNLYLHITRIGAIGAVATAGDVNGAGWAEFSSQCPAIIEAMAMEIVGT